MVVITIFKESVACPITTPPLWTRSRTGAETLEITKGPQRIKDIVSVLHRTPTHLMLTKAFLMHTLSSGEMIRLAIGRLMKTSE
jgi:hypothetical protein